MSRAWEIVEYKVLVRTAEENGLVGRREDNIKIDLEVLGCKMVDWINLIPFEHGNEPKRCTRYSKFLEWLSKCQLLKKESIHGTSQLRKAVIKNILSTSGAG
jgi:hypothetical protein